MGHRPAQRLSRCHSRRFATYWIDPYPLGDQASDLLAQRSGDLGAETADDFFGRLAGACDALNGHRPPAPEVAVATAKRALAGHRTAIPLHDMIREELDQVAPWTPLPPRSLTSPTSQVSTPAG